jgi:hypothetical protein
MSMRNTEMSGDLPEASSALSRKAKTGGEGFSSGVEHGETCDRTGRATPPLGQLAPTRRSALLVRSSFRIRHQGLNGIDRPGEIAAALVTDQLL